MFEYYTYPGNGETVQAVFEVIAKIAASGTMSGAAQAAALFGFLITLCVAVYKLDLRDSFVNILSIAAVWMVIMTPKTQVLITETSGYGFTGRQYAVSNIPFGLAAAGNIISSFGVNITRKMEQVSTLPNDLNYSQTGILFGTRLYDQIKTARFQDPVLVHDWALFMNQCSFYDVNLYHLYSIEELSRSSDILKTLGKTNKVLFTNVTNANTASGRFSYQRGSTTMTCDKAYAVLAARSNTLLRSQILPQTAQNVLGQMGVRNVPNTNQALLAVGNTSFRYLLNNARVDTLKMLEQSAMAELLHETALINAKRNNDQIRATEALAKVQARNQYVQGQKNSGWMAAWSLPIVRSVLEAVLLGLFPLVIVIGLMSGVMALRSIGFYMMTLMWLQLWAPVASMINLALSVYARQKMSALTVGAVSITPATSDNLLATSADLQVVAGATMWLVPMIAFALTMGGRSLANGVLGLAQSGKSAAENAGAKSGTGDVSGGNMNYNNANANKDSRNAAYTDPQMSTRESAIGTSYRNRATGESVYQGRADSAGNIASTASVSLENAFNKQASQKWSEGEKYSAVASESYTAGMQKAAQWTLSYASKQSGVNGYGLGLNANQSQALAALFKTSQEIADKHSNVSATEVAKAIATGNRVGLNAGLGTSNAGGSLSGYGDKQDKFNDAEKLQVDISNAVKALKDQGVTFNDSIVNTAMASNAFQEEASKTGTLANSATASFTHSNEARKSAETSYAQSKEYSEAATQAGKSGATVQVNTAAAMAQQYTPQEIHAMGKNPAQYADKINDALLNSQEVKKALEQSSNQAGLTSFRSIGRGDMPQNKVEAAHQGNVANVSAGSGGNFAVVSAAAAAGGVTPGGMEAAIERSRNIKGDVENVVTSNQQKIDQGLDVYNAEATRLHTKDAKEGINWTKPNVKEPRELGNIRYQPGNNDSSGSFTFKNPPKK